MRNYKYVFINIYIPSFFHYKFIIFFYFFILRFFTVLTSVRLISKRSILIVRIFWTKILYILTILLVQLAEITLRHNLMHFVGQYIFLWFLQILNLMQLLKIFFLRVWAFLVSGGLNSANKGFRLYICLIVLFKHA